MPGFAIGGGSGLSNTARFHREHRWEIITLGIPSGASGVGRPNLRTITRSSAGGGGDPTKLYAKSIQLPALSFENEEVQGASHTYKFAKKAAWDDLTITFYDTFGLYKSLKTWQDMIWTPEDGIGVADKYKGNPIFGLTDEQGSLVQRYQLVGAYPRKISHGDLSYTNSDIKLLSVVFTYDWAQITLEDNAGGGSNLTNA
jgi:hypothetical protein